MDLLNKLITIIRRFISFFDCLHCDHSNCLLSALRALRNGIYYGGKVRLIHCIVMEIITWKSKTWKDAKNRIVTPTIQHSFNLGYFAFIYKAVVCLLKILLKTENKGVHFIAGIIGAIFCWSKKTAVNTQIALYFLSRNSVAIGYLLKKRFAPTLGESTPIVSVLVWGVIMFLFEYDATSLQNSLKNSMDFIYKDSDSYSNWRDFIPLYVPF